MTGTSRDIGLTSHAAGKGDAPRNVGPKFYENYDEIHFGCRGLSDPIVIHSIERDSGFKRRGNKLTKKYK